MDRATLPVYISTAAVSASSPLDAIEQILSITPNIELTGGCSYDPHLLQKLLDFQKEHPLNLLLHSYFPPPEHNFVLNFADKGVQTRGFVSRAMEYVQTLGAPYYSIHAGFKKDFISDRYGILHKISDRTFTLDEIRENVMWFRTQWPDTPLALENIYPNGGDTSCAFMMSCDEICEALDTIPDIFLLLDLGHLKVSANLMGFDYEEAARTIFKLYRERIIEIHLSENNGLIDDHLPIEADSLQLQLLKKHLKPSDMMNINLTIEARGTNFSEIFTSYQNVSSLFQTR